MKLFTIGYATKPLEEFIRQLQHYNIHAVADVRSVPYSKAFFDYHQEAIAATLRSHKIHYVYLGEELGPRSKDDSHYDKTGQIQFDRLMQTSLFKTGIKRLEKGLDKAMNIALMCAEKDPATCHRSLLIGYYLQRNHPSIELLHICHNGNLETQVSLESRVIAMYSTGQDLFMTPQESAEQAYKKQLQVTSYRKPD